MQSKTKARQKVTLQTGWGQAQEDTLNWRSQDLKLLLGWSVLENWVNVSLTSRDWALCHQLLSHVNAD
jgi:hypothetical protein